MMQMGMMMAGRRGGPLLRVIQSLGLATNLKLCLDAGDINSYSGSGQTWADRSGQATDFYRGTTSGSDATDPTFNGSGGSLSSYWSFDGGDYFTLVSGANPSWIQPFHKDGATLTIMAGLYPTAAAAVSPAILADSDGSAVGFKFGYTGSTPGHHLFVGNGAAGGLSAAPVANMTASAWNIVGVSLSENGGASAGVHSVNQTTETFSPAYASPSAASATNPVKIGINGPASAGPLQSGDRLGFLAVWDIALTAAQMQSIFARTRGRYGI